MRRTRENVIEMKANKANGTGDIGELRGLLAASKAAGLKTALIRIPVRLFAIDGRYQTPVRTERDLTYLTNSWNERKLLPVAGVPHEEEGLVYLVDGYGRWKASQIIDPVKYESLNCMVLLDAPEDPRERLKFEAEMYAFQNRNVAKMREVQKHGAYECLEHPAALAIDELQKKFGFAITKSQGGQREGGVLGSYDATFEICRVNGKGCLEYILRVCRDSRFDNKTNGYSAAIFRALRDIWKFYPESRKETGTCLGRALRSEDPAKLKAAAVTRYPRLDFRAAISLYMEDVVVESLDLAHTREIFGDRLRNIEAPAIAGSGSASSSASSSSSN